MRSITGRAVRLFHFYYDGFRTMSWWGKRVWLIIILKLFIMFAVLKIFFFPDFLEKEFGSDKQRSEFVLDQLTNPSFNND